MSQTLSYVIQINSNFEKVNASFNKFTGTVQTGVDRIQRSLNTIKLQALISNIDSVANGLNAVNEPGLKLSSSLADLEAITGTTGRGLKEIEGYARENAKTFGGSAAEGVEAYKLILSQLTPEIAKQPKALQEMGNAVSTLSKTMGGDTVAATEVLTTAMNQYQISTADPIAASKKMSEMMNIMAAAAKEGSGELPQIKQALENSGLAAKTANVSFAETNAAIQVLDKSGKKGAEGGVALRNVLATLSEGRFLPKDVKAELQGAGIDVNALTDKSKSLKERLEPLKKIMTDQALVTKLFGKENSNAAIALISGTTEMERLTGAIQGTNTAYEQAAVVMESPLEKNKRLQSQIDNFKISIFNGTNGLIGYASVIGKTATEFAGLIPLMSGAASMISTLTNVTRMQAIVTGVATKAQFLFNAVMSANPVFLIIAGVVALIAVVATMISYWDQFGAAMSLVLGPVGMLIGAFMSLRDHWESITAAFSGGGFIAGLKRIGIVMLDVLLKPVQQLLELIAKLPGMGGLAGAGAASIKAMRQSMDLIAPGEKQANVTNKVAANKIAAATIPGMATNKNNAGDTSKIKKSNEAVASGGTKHNYITISIKELIGLKADSVSGGKDAATKSGNGVADELLRVLAMASTATG